MTDQPRPLAGLRVVALEHAVAAPLCSRHLADLGADVIKVERPGGGDFSRSYDTLVKGLASHFVWLNYGKRSIALDVKSEEGRATLLRLLESADVFIANLSPGAIDRLVSPDDLERLNPRLITCEISGYGPTGPFKERKAFDLLVQGEAGVTANTGLPGQPAKPGVSLADLGGGVYAATAILAALRARDLTGRGCRLTISMFDVLAEWMSPLLLAYREGGVAVEPAGTRHATITPYGPFVAADGAVVNIAVQNDRQWLLLCEVLGLADAASDPRWSTNPKRFEHRVEVEAAVAAAVSTWSSGDLEAALDGHGIPWGRLNQTAEVAVHPQLEAAGRWRAVQLPGGDRVRVIADPFHSGETGARCGTPRVPALGEHTDDILRELAGTEGD
jgi:crotonobetainyl-CoA:carnitine CoA-transferase CaiB-like acyl-CoA transferase